MRARIIETSRTLAIAAALLGMSACEADRSEPTELVEADQPAPADDAANDDTVWLTMGADARAAVLEAIERGEIDGAFHEASDDGKVVVFETTHANLAELSHLMHVTFLRCSGFVAHPSHEKAAVALDPTRIQETVDKQLINYTIDNSAAVQALVPSLQQSSVVATITHLSTQYINRYHTTTNGTNAAIWIRDTWQQYINASGRTDATVELYNHGATSQPSVILTIPGDWFVDEVVVVGGHLDSIAGFSPGPSTPAPGADDNASGIATLSEVARVLLADGFYPDRTVKFMAYSAEEVGLVGSGEIANDFASQGIDVVGVLQLDMTNYQGSAYDIVLLSDYTNAAQNSFIANLIDTYQPTLSRTYSSCGYACSDHASWTNAGFAASTPFESVVGDHNPYIHSSSDTLSNSDASGAHAMKFATLATTYIAELAKGDFTDDWTPPPGATAVLLPDSVGVYETRNYGPYPVLANTSFDARLDTNGYADVYVKFGAPPTITDYDCRPYTNTPEEHCSLTVPGADTQAYVMVRGYMATYTLGIAYFDSTAPPAPITDDFSGSVAQGQEVRHGPFDVSSGTTFIANMTGTGDADLYVRFGAPPTLNDWDCRPYVSGSNENCNRVVPSGETQAYVMIHGYTSATYNLTVTHTP